MPMRRDEKISALVISTQGGETSGDGICEKTTRGIEKNLGTRAGRPVAGEARVREGICASCAIAYRYGQRSGRRRDAGQKGKSSTGSTHLLLQI